MSEEKLDLILEKLTTMDERLLNVENNQQKMKSEQQQVKQAVLETLDETKQVKSAVSKLTEGQGRQDKILESLAVRSLEQETDIKDLKRIK